MSASASLITYWTETDFFTTTMTMINQWLFGEVSVGSPVGLRSVYSEAHQFKKRERVCVNVGLSAVSPSKQSLRHDLKREDELLRRTHRAPTTAADENSAP